MQRQSIDFAKVLYASSDNTELIKINNADWRRLVRKTQGHIESLCIETN